MGNSGLNVQGFWRWSWFDPREPTVGVLPAAFIYFFLFNIMNTCKLTEKVKDFYTDSPYAHNLD